MAHNDEDSTCMLWIPAKTMTKIPIFFPRKEIKIRHHLVGYVFLNTSATSHAIEFLTTIPNLFLLPDQQNLHFTNSLVVITFFVHIMFQQYLGKFIMHCTVTWDCRHV